MRIQCIEDLIVLRGIYDRIERLGLPGYATLLIKIAVFCIPIAFILFLLPRLAERSSTSRAPIPIKPARSENEAPKKLQPDSKKAEFSKVKEWMTVQEVQAIMGEGEVEKYGAPPGHTAEMHAYYYADGKVQVVVYADGKVAGSKEFTK